MAHKDIKKIVQEYNKYEKDIIEACKAILAILEEFIPKLYKESNIHKLYDSICEFQQSVEDVEKTVYRFISNNNANLTLNQDNKKLKRQISIIEESINNLIEDYQKLAELAEQNPDPMAKKTYRAYLKKLLQPFKILVEEIFSFLTKAFNLPNKKSSNAIDKLARIENFLYKNSHADFKITLQAESTILKLEKLSPGLMQDLYQHFNERINTVEEYLKTLNKNEQIKDNAEMELLRSNWRQLMKSAESGVDSFCAEITKYLDAFEKGMAASENLDTAALDNRGQMPLNFSKIDKQIKEHIKTIQTKHKPS